MINDAPEILREYGITKVTVMPLPINGSLDIEHSQILINEHDSQFQRLLTFIHEYMHLTHPDWDEVKVKAEEDSILISLEIGVL